MPTFHVQKIRSCVQCGSILPLKCVECLKHPNRKSKVIELYDFPPILATAECGCCVKIKCQAPECEKNFWRYMRLNYKEGKSKAQNFVCSKYCAVVLANSFRKSTSMEVYCHFGCGEKIWAQKNKLKMNRYIYCSPAHCYLHRRKLAYEKHLVEVKTKRKQEVEYRNLALLQCLNGCQGTDGDKITEHILIPDENYSYKCKECGKIRPCAISAINWKEKASLMRPVNANQRTA